MTKKNINLHAENITKQHGATTNCKLTIISDLSIFDGPGISEEDKIKMFDKVLLESLQVVYLNTPLKRIADFIVKNYELYGYSEIPVGYNYAPIQYHIFVRNTKVKREYLNDPIKTVIEINPYKDNFVISNENPMIKIIDNRREIKNKK